MEDLSVLLWAKLYRFVGTEALVCIRRRYALLYDILHTNFKENVIVLQSGSKAEGLVLPGSDLDIMGVWKGVSVLPTSNTDDQDCDLCTETNNTKPGFVRLRVVDGISFVCNPMITTSIVELNQNMYVSSNLFLKNVVDILRESGDVEYHGPCASTIEGGHFELDTLPRLHCPVWPNEASEWIHRYRPNDWPSTEIVQQIVAGGYLLAPIGNPQSDTRNIEWRISFSIPEKMLVHSMNHTQLLCYGLLKLYLKNVIDCNEETNGLLCSYFLKTCLFYCIEQENISWNKENLIKCFWTCFKRLYKWVREEYCPNYFIKDNNMFESKIHGDNQRKLQQYLTTLYGQGLDVFIKIPCLADIPAISINSDSSRLPLNNHPISEPEHEFLCDMELLNCACAFEIRAINYMLPEALQSQSNLSEVDQVLISSAVFDVNVQISQHIYYKKVHLHITNKEKFKTIKQLRHFILSFSHGDICTGLLQYATLCYVLGQYDKVTHIAMHVLSKFNEKIMFVGASHFYLQSDPAYISEVCGRGLTEKQKRKHYVAHQYICIPDCEMYPLEIRSEIINLEYLYEPTGLIYINPAVYCHVLLCLAYNAMGLIELRDGTLTDLYVAAHFDDIVDDLERPLSIALLEKLKSAF